MSYPTHTEQIIADATILIDAVPGASTMRTVYDPVRAGERDNYRCAWIKEMDLLSVAVPVEGARCRFRLLVTPGVGRHDSQTYVVTDDGVLWLAEYDPRQDATSLNPAGGTAVTRVGDLVTEALSFCQDTPETKETEQ